MTPRPVGRGASDPPPLPPPTLRPRRPLRDPRRGLGRTRGPQGSGRAPGAAGLGPRPLSVPRRRCDLGQVIGPVRPRGARLPLLGPLGRPPGARAGGWREGRLPAASPAHGLAPACPPAGREGCGSGPAVGRGARGPGRRPGWTCGRLLVPARASVASGAPGLPSGTWSKTWPVGWPRRLSAEPVLWVRVHRPASSRCSPVAGGGVCRVRCRRVHCLI